MTEKKKGSTYAGYTTARKRANSKYESENVERISLVVPKGKKLTIKSHADQCGQSVNGFINLAIDKSILDSGDSQPTSAPATSGCVAVQLSDKTIKAAQKGAERTGESVSDFISRSIAEQFKRDNMSLDMGIRPAVWKEPENQ